MRIRTILLIVAAISIIISFTLQMNYLLSTSYTTFFDENLFRKIKIGYSATQVKQLIGEPFCVREIQYSTNKGNTVKYYKYEYSKSPIGSSYHIKEVDFDSSWTVFQIIDAYHND